MDKVIEFTSQKLLFHIALLKILSYNRENVKIITNE